MASEGHANPASGSEPDHSLHSFESLCNLPPVYKHLAPHFAQIFTDCAERIAQSFLANPCESTLLDFLALPKVGLVPGLRKGYKAAAERLKRYPAVAWPEPDETERARRDGTAEATRLIESGRLSAAAQALKGDSRVAPINHETIAVLNEKHPDSPDSPLPGTEPPVPYSPEAFPADLFDSVIASSRPDTAPGPSGWTVPLLRHVLRAPSGVPLLQHLTHHIARDTAPGRSMLVSSRLTSLLKDDGGIRPIAVGNLIYRVCSKALLNHVLRPDFLPPNQFGVGSKGGIEPIAWAVQLALDNKTEQQFTHLTTLHFSNAFNTISRQELSARSLAPGAYRWPP